MPDLTCSDVVQDVLDGEDITLPDLQEMVLRGAITSLRGANRRYHHWFFEYDSKRNFVSRMFLHLPVMMDVSSWVSCTGCGSWGCKQCGWSGQVPG